MKTPHEISESPDKPNITYVVEYIPRDANIQQYFDWLVAEVQVHGVRTERTIIYCQTIQQCGVVYATLKSIFGASFFVDKTGDRRNVVLEMLHSCSPPANKESVLNSFRVTDGVVRILVATIAFGMGVDCKGVHRTIHFGPSMNLESFVQETGRAGRDGAQSTSYVLYHGLLLTHVGKDIKEYIQLKDCRRKGIRKHFAVTTSAVTTSAVTTSTVLPGHKCCDNCALTCECDLPSCGKQFTKYPSVFLPNDLCIKERSVTEQQKNDLVQLLTVYHKSLVLEFLAKHAHGDIKPFTSLSLLIGFSELQISQVKENCSKIFNVSDIYNFVEIWHHKHAVKIQSFISQVFGDVSKGDEYQIVSCSPDSDTEDELELAITDWNTIIEDDDFLDLILENLDRTELSIADKASTMCSQPSHTDIPNAVQEFLENVSFKE